TVTHAAAFMAAPFVCAPIRSRRLMSSSMKTSTIGKSTPFATCDRDMTGTSGTPGIKKNAAPGAVRAGERAVKRGAPRVGLLTPISHPSASQTEYAVARGSTEAEKTEALKSPKAKRAAQ